MSVGAQIIIAVGVAGLLLLLGSAVVIWSVRCAAKLPHYRLPTLFALSVPITISIVWAVAHLS
jgi:hypothetical protein